MSFNTHVDQSQPIHILALDGGGVRGLSSLLILRDLMRRIERREGRTLRPCEYFDFMIGTGTGAISALFLGRLGMTVDDAIAAYTKVAEKAFEPPHKGVARVLTGRNALLDGSILEREVGEIVAHVTGSSDTVIANTEAETIPSCPIAVLAATAANADSPPHVFRSHASGSRSPSYVPISQVARATAATASFFSPVELGDPPVRFIDAGVAGYNNPTEVGLDEAAVLWPGSCIECVVSLGTGLQNIASVGDAWSTVVEGCRTILQSCEVVHNRMMARGRREGFSYFRFNVDRGLHSIDITEWRGSGPRGQLVGITEAYTRWVEVEERLDKCVRALIHDDTDTAHVSLVRRTSSTQRRTDKEAALPGVPPIFHGRRDRIRTAVDIFKREGAARLALLGAGGIGKTSIALKILHDGRIAGTFGRHRYFISCEGVPSLQLLIDSLCATFAVPLDAVNRDRDCQRTEFLAFMRQQFLSCPALLVLDNLETVWDVEGVQTDVEDFLRGLGDAKMLSLLITMRGTEYPGGLRWTSPRLPEVQPLDPDAARAAFKEICSHDNIEGPELDGLLREIDYVPLVVTLMARLAQNESLTDLTTRWKEEHTRLLSRPRHKDRQTNVELSIRVSLESYRMQSTPEAFQLLRTISMLPLGAFDTHLAPMCPRIPNLKEASLILREVALAYHDSVRTLRLLSPIRMYILENHPAALEHLQDVETFHFDLARKCAESNGDAEGILTLPRGQNIEAIIIQALSSGRDGGAVQAALHWTRFLRRTHHPRTAVIEAAVQFLQKKGAPGQDRVMECLYSLGDTQRLLHQYEAAQTALCQARDQCEIFKKPFGVAECMRSLGGVWTLTGKYVEAEAALTKAQGIYESLGDLHKVAACLRSLGDVWRRKGRYDEAEAVFARARDQYEALGDIHDVMHCLRSLGDVWRRRGKYDKAEEVLIQARSYHEATGDSWGVARCLWSLGEVAQRRGQYDAAEEVLTQSHDRYKSIGATLGVADCLRSLGELWRKTGKYEEAEEALTKAQNQYEALGNPTGMAGCLWSLGELWRRRCMFEQAEGALNQARARYEDLEDPLGIADCMKSIGEIWLSKRKYDEAEDAFTHARARYEILDASHGQADCLASLGLVYHGQANHQSAKDSLNRAREIFEHNGYTSGRALSLLSMGRLSRDLGELEEAKQCFDEAKIGFEKLGVSMQRQHEECIKALSELEDAVT